MFPLSHLLKRFIRVGTMKVIDAGGKVHTFGGTPGPIVACRIHNRTLPFKLFFNPELAAGEAYMDGTLTFEGGTVHDFLRIFGVNNQSLGKHPMQALLRAWWKKIRSLQQYNPLGTAKKNVAHHYDLSPRLYELFLDPDLQYSCAYFQKPGDSLETAQLNKKRLIASKLMLAPGQKILEIGSGWGGLGLYLASCADVDITGVTLSEEQHKISCERVKKLGLEKRVRFLLKDYREVEGRFDRIVSVAMMEAVGVRHFGEYFGKIRDMLTDDGIAMVHSIGKMSPPGTTGPWIRKYIFPGGYSPALSEVFEATEKQKLWVTDVEILRLHYARTLAEWNIRFQANRAEVATMYDERFCRMWEFYLAACEMFFVYGSGMVFHMQLSRKRDAVPLSRSYISEEEFRLRLLDTGELRKAG